MNGARLQSRAPDRSIVMSHPDPTHRFEEKTR